jgi:hypothetical protein
MGMSAAIVEAFSQTHVPGLLLPAGVVCQLRLAACLFQMVMANQRPVLQEVSLLRLEASVWLPAAHGLACLVERA